MKTPEELAQEYIKSLEPIFKTARDDVNRIANEFVLTLFESSHQYKDIQFDVHKHMIVFDLFIYEHIKQYIPSFIEYRVKDLSEYDENVLIVTKHNVIFNK